MRRVELKCWSTLVDLDPKHQIEDGEPWHYRAEAGFPSPKDSAFFTEAAQNTGIIQKVWPYEPSSPLVDKSKAAHNHGIRGVENEWDPYIFRSMVTINTVPYDQRFCLLLRAGLEDPYVTLMMALLPNVRELIVHAAPSDVHALPWQIPKHGFKQLRHFVAAATDGELPWPIAYFNEVFKVGRLDCVQICKGSCWWDESPIPGPTPAIPFNLEAASVDISTLNLDSCHLVYPELDSLVKACSRLKNFYFSTDEAAHPDETYILSPGELVRILERRKDTLEKVSLDTNRWATRGMPNETNAIGSFAQFTHLQLLDTRPDMWSALCRDHVDEHLLYEGVDIPEEDRLHYRLPASLRWLIFHDYAMTEDEDNDIFTEEVFSPQIRGLLSARAATLPHLEYFGIESRRPTYRANYKHARDFYEDISRQHHGDTSAFEFRISSRKERRLAVTTYFHNLGHTSDMDKLQWKLDRYAYERRLPLPWDHAFRKFKQYYGRNYNPMDNDPTKRDCFYGLVELAEGGELSDTEEEAEDNDDLISEMGESDEASINSSLLAFGSSASEDEDNSEEDDTDDDFDEDEEPGE